MATDDSHAAEPASSYPHGAHGHAPPDYAQKHPRPTAEEIKANPSYPSTIWRLTPTKKGKLPVAAHRGGPFNLSWEIHGSGPTKLVWIMGLGAIKSAWQRQTHKFGHLEGDKYSVLVYDNRGIGESDKPLMRYSTSEMAEDALEVLGHVGWVGERELHVIGVSMGGMIAQELALKAPQRVASLALCSTAARVEQTIPFLEHLRNRISMFIPKSIDRAVQDAAFNLFPDTFLDAPEQIRLPTKESPNVEPPPAAGGWATGYGAWSTNFERFAATELTKRADKEAFTRKGFILQAIAAGWHNVSTERLKTLGDTVGRERIMVIHGTEDRMLTFPHGETLARELELREKGGEVHFLEGSGHVLMIEKNEWHDGVLAGLWERTDNL